MRREHFLLLGTLWLMCWLWQRRSHTVPASASGLRFNGEDVSMMDWNRWMEVAPKLIKNSIDEGEATPEEIVNNLAKRVFPEYRWPPLKNEKHFGVWSQMVQTVASTLSKPHVPQLKVV